MAIAALDLLLNKEPILRTAKPDDLRHHAGEIEQQYRTYAATHIPLGTIAKQLADLRRVIVENKACVVGSIVGPYGYGKTSTAVHLWHELAQKQILAIPPFQWLTLEDLITGVYGWIRYIFEQGHRAYVPDLDALYERYCSQASEQIRERMDRELFNQLRDRGQLILNIQPENVIEFYHDACLMCEQAGYKGMVVFTDELQVTVADYKPSMNQFFADFFQLLNTIQIREGHWAWIVSMNDDTEGKITQFRSDIHDRMQRSALFFRVKDIYNRREFPAELWAAYQKHFAFDGNEVIDAAALEALGQIAMRDDLGAGPRMVTVAFSRGIRFYKEHNKPFTPIDLIDDFLNGQILFDKQGKLATIVRHTLESLPGRDQPKMIALVKLLSAFPEGCAATTLQHYRLYQDFEAFPPVARRDLFVELAGGYTLRPLAQQDLTQDTIEQRLMREFTSQYAPGKSAAIAASSAWFLQVLLEYVFTANAWKPVGRPGFTEQGAGSVLLRGSADPAYPDRVMLLSVATVKHSQAPEWKRGNGEADFELRFELNYDLQVGEPNSLIVSPDRPYIAILQLNLQATQAEEARKLPKYFLEYLPPERWSIMLALALIDYLAKNRGDNPNEQSRVNQMMVQPRQFALSLLLGERLVVRPEAFASGMVGDVRLKELIKRMCQKLYPNYHTLKSGPRWLDTIGYYRQAIEKLTASDHISIIRGKQLWETTKENAADVFGIPGRRIANLEPLFDGLRELIIPEEYSGRSASSEIKLRFRLHPLEEEWLKLLEASSEVVKLPDGQRTTCLPHQELMSAGRREGYALDEIGEILRLLAARKYVTYDEKRGLLVRNIETIVDLKVTLSGSINVLEANVQALARTFSDFDASLYPLRKLRDDLEAATERDQADTVRVSLRESETRLKNYATSRVEKLRENMRSKIEELHRQKLPQWLAIEFGRSPLQAYLEHHRRDVAAEYTALLQDVQALHAANVSWNNPYQGPRIEESQAIYQAFRQLDEQMGNLMPRLKGIDAQQQIFQEWRNFGRAASDLEREATRARDIFGYAMFVDTMSKLWEGLRANATEQPSTFFNRYREVIGKVQTLHQEVDRWLEGRRDEFSKLCAQYTELLATCGISTNLAIPFDRDEPARSQQMLYQAVNDAIVRALDLREAAMKEAQRKVRYGIRIQKLPLGDLEQQSAAILTRLAAIRQQLVEQAISQPATLAEKVTGPIEGLARAQRELIEAVQRTAQQHPAEGRERELLERLMKETGHEIDLRAFIVQTLESGRDVDFSEFMRISEGLFQKNLIDIRITLPQERR